MITGWRGLGGPYDSSMPGDGEAGGGLEYSHLTPGRVQAILPGSSGGGGQVPTTGELLANGCGGCGGPGPAALYGIGE